MKAEKQQLLALIHEYRDTIKKAVDMLNAKSRKSSGFQHQRAGYLDDSMEARYEFHGVGCLIIAKDFKIDFDFGEGGRCDGVDPWFLFCFLDENKGKRAKYPLLTSEEQVRELLKNLEAENLLLKNLDPYNDRFYYLPSDVYDIDKPIWRPNQNNIEPSGD